MKILHLTDDSIEEARQTDTPRWGMTVYGYTKRSGAPTSWLVRLKGENRWRRLMIYQFSNAGSVFLRVKGEVLFVNEWSPVFHK